MNNFVFILKMYEKRLITLLLYYKKLLMHKSQSPKTVLGTTYFLVKDREKYETEVYNPSSVVERVTMVRQTKRDTNAPIRRVRRSSLHLDSG